MLIKTVLLLFTFTCLVVGLKEFERQHMKEHHNVEINDEVTFFKLHDLDGDGYWDEGELKYMFGIESDVDPNSSRIQHIIARIYQEIDTNKDRFISLNEYIAKTLATITERDESNGNKLNQPKVPKSVNKNRHEGIPLKFRV